MPVLLQDETDEFCGPLSIWTIYHHPDGSPWAVGHTDIFGSQCEPHAFATTLPEIRAKVPPGARRMHRPINHRVIFESWIVEGVRITSVGRRARPISDVARIPSPALSAASAGLSVPLAP